MTQKTRIIFAGTPEFSVATLNALIPNYEIVAVYTQPDRPSGRGQKLQSSPVKAAALLHNIPVFQPVNFKNSEDIATLQALNADIMIVVAYGLLLPPIILEAPRLGCLNIHASLLPRWRGAAPIQRAILAGDNKTGVCIMQMDKGLDTGDIWSSAEFDILPSHTSGILFDSLSHLGAQLILDTLPKVLAQSSQPTKQALEGVSYAKKIEKNESPINWDAPKEIILRHVMGLNPFPGATTRLMYQSKVHENLTNNIETLKIWRISNVTDELNNTLTVQLNNVLGLQPKNGLLMVYDKKLYVCVSQGWLHILDIQQPGKKIISTDQFILNKALSGVVLL